MGKILRWFIRHSQWTRNNRGGGGEPERQTVVTPPPVDQPDPAATARSLAQVYQEEFPRQFGLGEERAGFISQMLDQPEYLTPEELSAQEAIRGRETERLQRALRTRANLGGGLFGGRAAGTEERAMSELAQAYSAQDIMNRQNRMMALLGMGGGIPPQQVIPSGSSVYGGQMQAALANQPQVMYQQAQPSPWWGIGGSALGAAGTIGAGMALASSRRYKKNIKLWAEPYNSSLN